ncbi:sodium:solute symporter [Prevotella sp. kh1p2]|uniref:sodium:solute symporter n=1 Tax=Prevotella sp. kh1p2 TaxID=1761883 RepID=UPI0008D2F900|nr:sodium:solute symporter [Prevotella sp. kh1p2]SES80350.1 Na+/proline symporter [Prevotella sp. kh1p2]SNU10713.1 Na+/proline symporter [Prevotellaceae bacterium KH2P17]
MIIILTIFLYFCVLLVFSRLTARTTDNDTFFRANRKSPWYMVAFGMIGASISGVSFVSVPGMVLKTGMTYMQTCIGFIFGYIAVAFLLLPVYYRLNLTTIYSYLQQRLGERSYKTGAAFFLLSKMTGAAVKFYVVCIILQEFVLNALGVPFALTVTVLVALIWLYTRNGGIKTLVWTDSFQTLCMFTALVLIIVHVTGALGLTAGEAIEAVAHDGRSRMFVFDDWVSKQNFWKQFLSGIFIVIVMTGLDQDMMQKNLTCKSLRAAQKDMCSYGLAFVPANLLFLALGVLLAQLAEREGMALPASGDELVTMFAASGRLGETVVVLFTVGIVAASFSTADSALTSLTTSFCIDIRNKPDDESYRRRVHILMAAVFAGFILLFRAVNSTSLIDAVYIMCSYTYGPLLGLFAFGLLTNRPTNDRLVPHVAVASPFLCFALDTIIAELTGYKFGYELLMLNGALTFAGLWLAKR